ncbi:MAG TPA: homoserine kinase [Terrimesophilobacter sp.]|nr:homoserine kinase [Terrimesophilobacter sp.]
MTVSAAGCPGSRVEVKVPATSANLGPGFDSLGLALSLYSEVSAVVREEPGAQVSVHGVGEGELPTDESNLIVRTISTVFDSVGRELPGLKLEATNNIPHGRGLGSSGAAIVAGVMAAKGLLAGDVELDSQRLLSIASELEGHPDNVAPALFGGLTIAWSSEEGPQFKKLTVHRGVSPLVCVPQQTMSTEVARGLRPESVSHEDAAFNVSRSALLIAALVQSPELLFAATEDRLHQSYRAVAMPETQSLLAALRGTGHAAVVSGSGPSVLVLCSDPAERLAAAELVAAHPGSPWEPLMLAVDFKGATVSVLPVDDSD